MLLSVAISLQIGALLFETSSKYPSINPSQEFKFNDEDIKDWLDDFWGDSGWIMISGGVCLVPGVSVVMSSVVLFWEVARIVFMGGAFSSFELNLEVLRYQYAWVGD